MFPLFFVHVPKTAGTSFRKSAENFFGEDAVLYDYSPQSEDTSPLINSLVYQQPDFFEFYHAQKSNRCAFLSGHVNAAKYAHLFGVDHTVTFLRDPLQRIVSEYYHFVRHNGYKGDLPSFYRRPQFINRQSSMLQGVQLSALGVVGLNEVYENSLAMINARFGLEIKSTFMNMGRKRTDQWYELPDDQREELQVLNKEDVALYRRAQGLFDTRWALFQQNLPFVHSDIQQLNDKSISGWAWWSAERTDAVELTLRVNGDDVGNTQATQLRPGMLRLGLPRMGYIGFQHHFTKALKPGDWVEVIVTETGQLIDKRQFPNATR